MGVWFLVWLVTSVLTFLSWRDLRYRQELTNAREFNKRQLVCNTPHGFFFSNDSNEGKTLRIVRSDHELTLETSPLDVSTVVDQGEFEWRLINTNTGRISATTLSRSSTSAAEYRIAFVGDSSASVSSSRVLQLVKQQNANVLVHLGDMDYRHSPALWFDFLDEQLGFEFPVVQVVGNHDVLRYSWSQYSREITSRWSRFQKVGMSILSLFSFLFSSLLFSSSVFHYICSI